MVPPFTCTGEPRIVTPISRRCHEQLERQGHKVCSHAQPFVVLDGEAQLHPAHEQTDQCSVLSGAAPAAAGDAVVERVARKGGEPHLQDPAVAIQHCGGDAAFLPDGCLEFAPVLLRLVEPRRHDAGLGQSICAGAVGEGSSSAAGPSPGGGHAAWGGGLSGSRPGSRRPQTYARSCWARSAPGPPSSQNGRRGAWGCGPACAHRRRPSRRAASAARRPPSPARNNALRARGRSALVKRAPAHSRRRRGGWLATQGSSKSDPLSSL